MPRATSIPDSINRQLFYKGFTGHQRKLRLKIYDKYGTEYQKIQKCMITATTIFLLLAQKMDNIATQLLQAQ